MLKSFFFSCLILFDCFTFAMDEFKVAFKDHDGMKQGIEIELSLPGGKNVIIHATKDLIARACSGFLDVCLEAASKDAGDKQPRFMLEVEDRKSFLQVIEFLKTGQLQFSGLDDLRFFIAYAHKFDIKPLGEKIAEFVESVELFYARMDSITEPEPILDLVRTIRDANYLPNKKGTEEMPWNQRLLHAISSYMNYRGHLMDAHSKCIYGLFQKKYKHDEAMKPFINLGINVVNSCAEKARVKTSQAEDQARQDQEQFLIRQGAEEEAARQKMAEQLAPEADKEAEKLYQVIIEKYNWLSRNHHRIEIFVRVPISRAKLLAQALRRIFERDDLDLDVKLADDIQDHSRDGRILCCCQPKIPGYEHSCAQGMGWSVNNILGFICCPFSCLAWILAGHDCFEKKAPGRWIFSCCHKGLTNLSNNCKGATGHLVIKPKD